MSCNCSQPKCEKKSFRWTCVISRGKKRKWYDPTFLKFSSSEERERQCAQVRACACGCVCLCVCLCVCVKYQCLLASFEYEINLFSQFVWVMSYSRKWNKAQTKTKTKTRWKNLFRISFERRRERCWRQLYKTGSWCKKCKWLLKFFWLLLKVFERSLPF